MDFFLREIAMFVLILLNDLWNFTKKKLPEFFRQMFILIFLSGNGRKTIA